MMESLPTPESTNDNRPLSPRKSRRALWICGGIVFLLVVAVVYVNLLPSRPLCISKETTYIIEPLKSNGKEMDYFAAIQQATRSENLATDENGYRLVVQHLGRHPDTDPLHFASICEQLGLDVHTIRPNMTYQEPWDFLRAYARSKEFDESLLDVLPPDNRSRDSAAFMLDKKLAWSWTLDDLPMMAAWLEQNGPALDLLGQAVRRPSFQIPLVRHIEKDDLGVSIALNELMRMRSFTRGLIPRANYRIATGDLDGAIDDIVTLKRLGRLVGHNPTSLGLLIGIAFEGMADAFGIAGSLEHPPTKEQLEELINQLDSLLPASEGHDKALTERLEWLAYIQSLSHGYASWQTRSEDLSIRHLGRLRIDWNGVACRFNIIVDETLASDGELSDISPIPPTGISFISIHARSKYVGDTLSSNFIRSWKSRREATRRRACTDQMHRITLAMLLYERDHGTLPPAWSVDVNGNPLHSWRVLLLPYLGHGELHKRIRLDEPWDSDYNRSFHGEPMPIYRCPSHPEAKPGQATYSVVVGPDMPFEPDRGKRFFDFGPHSDDMILLVERTTPVGWMEPTSELVQASADEGIVDCNREPPFLSDEVGRIGSHHRGIANFGFRDGAVLGFPSTDDNDAVFTPDLLRNLLRGTNTENGYRY